MITQELLQKVRRIEITTNRFVTDSLAGQYHSVFKGRGMSFSEVRPYQPGDDIRTIDWNVSARMNDLFVKLFVEERELTVMLLVDASASGAFGTLDRPKGDVFAELCAVLAFSAIENNDRVGLIIFTDQVEQYVPPKKGRKHVMRVVTEILSHRPRHTGTGVAAALAYLTRVQKRRTIAFVVSDFLCLPFERELRVARAKHDVIPVSILDPGDEELPDIGIAFLRDAETGEVMEIDTSDPRLRARYTAAQHAERHAREQLFRRLKIDFVSLRAGEDYVAPLTRFFRLRAHRW